MFVFNTLIMLAGCGEKETAEAPPVTEPAAQPEAPTAAPAAPAQAEPTPSGDDEATPPGRISARHILVAWQGTVGAESTLRRTRGEAEQRVADLQARVRAGEDFGALAREFSDGPSKVLGGDLGPFEADAMHANFSAAAFALKVNEVSDIVETPFGFHIIQRTLLEEVRVAHVLVQWTGIHRSEVERTQEEARQRAEQALTRLKAGESVGTVAPELSDGPTGVRGGELGWFQRGQMVPAFDEAAFALEPGGISEIVESPMGYHIIVRLE